MTQPEKYTLNIFTNLSDTNIGHIPITSTVLSFANTFSFRNVQSIKIFVHPQPFPKVLTAYKSYLWQFRDLFPDILISESKGLAHGYAKSIVL
jgi:hypothetical protein